MQPELPVSVSTSCGGVIPGFRSGSAPMTCRLTEGAHTVTAYAQMGEGTIYATSLTVTVQPPTVRTLVVTVSPHVIGVPPVTVQRFAATDVSAFRYYWAFDDGTVDATLIPRTTHAYAHGQYRATVTAVNAEGRTIGTGSVVVVAD